MGNKSCIEANERMIRKMMRERKVRGNSKNFVLLVGDRLLDYGGSYRMRDFKSGELKPVDDIQLLHKCKLHGILEAEFADLFWNRKVRIRVGLAMRAKLLPALEAKVPELKDDKNEPIG